MMAARNPARPLMKIAGFRTVIPVWLLTSARVGISDTDDWCGDRQRRLVLTIIYTLKAHQPRFVRRNAGGAAQAGYMIAQYGLAWIFFPGQLCWQAVRQ